MTARRVILWRHGETEWNAEGRFQGHADAPLSDRGRAQAEAAAPRIAALNPTRIVTSDLSRARDTAGALQRLTDLEAEVDPRLREIDVGAWQGLMIADVYAENPEYPERLAAGEDFRRSETGETGAECARRVALALIDQAEATPDGGVLVVAAHGFALRNSGALLMGSSLEQARSLVGMPNCAWTVMKPAGDRWRLQSYNNTV